MKTNIVLTLLSLAFLGFAQENAELVEKVDVGYAAPDFTLPDADGKKWTLSDYSDKIVVLEWVNHDCPYVKKCYGGHIQDIQGEFTAKDVIWFTIDSNKDANPQGAKINKRLYKGKQTAYLLDPSGETGRAYHAKQTPHMFVLGKDNIIRYHGALDSASTTKIEDINGPKVRHYVVNVLDSLVKGKNVWQKPTKPYGCAIKYAPVKSPEEKAAAENAKKQAEIEALKRALEEATRE